MVIVNKILNVLIFLLAIAACIASILLHQRRIELRGRADFLAKIVAEVAEKVDGDADSNTSTEIGSVEVVNPELLTWETYHKSRKLEGENYVFTDWKNDVQKLTSHVEELFLLKVKMAENFVVLQEKVKLDLKTDADGNPVTPEAYEASLNSVLTFDDAVKPALDKVSKVLGRGMVLSEQLVKITASLQKAQEASNFDIFSDNDEDNSELKSNLSRIADQASDLFSRSQVLAKGYSDILKGLEPKGDNPRYYTPDFDPSVMLSENTEDINQGIQTLLADIEKINTMLHEGAVAASELKDARTKLAQLEKIQEDLNKENTELHNKVGKLQADTKRLEKQLEEYKELVGKDRNIMKAGFEASIMEANDRYDFFTINKGRKHGVKNNVEMIVVRDNQFICRAVIYKVLEGIAYCNILPTVRATTTGEGGKKTPIMPQPGDLVTVP